MSNTSDSNAEYRAPSVKRWGTVLDLTSGADTGGSGDIYDANADNDHSNWLPDQSNGQNGKGTGDGS